MLKARLNDSTGVPIFVLGITGENVHRLVDGEPILVDLAELGGGPGKVVVTYGRDLQDLARQLHEVDPSVPLDVPEPGRGESFRFRPEG